MTLLQQLIFLFESRDKNTSLNVTNHTLTLSVKNVQNPDQVAKIASRMGMTIVGTNPVQISMSAPMKEAPPKPNTPFQQALLNLINGDEKYIGLRELMSYFLFRWESGDKWHFQGSKLEYAYLKAGGWNIMPDEGYYNPQVKNQTHPLWVAFEKEWSKTTFFRVSEPDGDTVRHETGAWFRGEKEQFLTHKSGSLERFGELLYQLINIPLVFSNGGNISFSKEKRRGKHTYGIKDDLELITPQVTLPSQFKAYENHLKYCGKITWHAEHGYLSEYLDVEVETVPKKKLVVDWKNIYETIRSALSSYLYEGVIKGYDHYTDGYRILVHTTDVSSFCIPAAEQKKLKTGQKRFDSFVEAETEKVLEHYRKEHIVKYG